MGPCGSVQAHIKTGRRHTTPRKLFRRLVGPRDPTENSKSQNSGKNQKTNFSYFSGWGPPNFLFGVSRWGHIFPHGATSMPSRGHLGPSRDLLDALRGLLWNYVDNFRGQWKIGRRASGKIGRRTSGKYRKILESMIGGNRTKM